MPSGMGIGGGQKGILLAIVSMPTRLIEGLGARKGKGEAPNSYQSGLYHHAIVVRKRRRRDLNP